MVLSIENFLLTPANALLLIITIITIKMAKRLEILQVPLLTSHSLQLNKVDFSLLSNVFYSFYRAISIDGFHNCQPWSRIV